jgi:hypothetical protein
MMIPTLKFHPMMTGVEFSKKEDENYRSIALKIPPKPASS